MYNRVNHAWYGSSSKAAVHTSTWSWTCSTPIAIAVSTHEDDGIQSWGALVSHVLPISRILQKYHTTYEYLVRQTGHSSGRRRNTAFGCLFFVSTLPVLSKDRKGEPGTMTPTFSLQQGPTFHRAVVSVYLVLTVARGHIHTTASSSNSCRTRGTHPIL